MKYTFEKANKVLINLGFETHYHTVDRTIIGMTYSCNEFGNTCALFDSKVTYNITYNVKKDSLL